MEIKDRKTFRLSKPSVLKFIGDYLRLCLASGKVYLISVTEETRDKTRAQLRAIFGVWAKEVSERTGHTVDEIHKEWKHMFLVNVYRENPRGEEQLKWLDILGELEEMQRFDIVSKYMETIHLSWASVSQAKQYMERIEQHYISVGIPLPPIDRDAIK